MKDLRFAHILLVEDSDADADFFQDFFERQRIGNKVTRVIYKDAAGYDTIGFGHLIKLGEKIQEPLFQGQFDAVVSWTYNLGEGALKSSTMLKKINDGQHAQVPGQMKRWTRAGGKGLKGLERRREAEAALYEPRWY
jgi:GH24 family phage-related lysozyme (muramidase)